MFDPVLNFLSTLQHGLVWDALLVAAIFAGTLLFAFTIGRNSLVVMFIAALFGGLVSTFMPPLSELISPLGWSEPDGRIAMFVLVSLVCAVILRRNRFFEPYVVPTGLERLAFALSLAGVLTVMILNLLAPTSTPSPLVGQLFLGQIATLAWLFSPLVLFTIFRGQNA